MAKIYHDADADLKVLKGKKVAVIGFGSQGKAQSMCMRDSGLDVVVGLQEGREVLGRCEEERHESGTGRRRGQRRGRHHGPDPGRGPG